MRSFSRLFVIVALVVSAGSLAPLASATPESPTPQAGTSAGSGQSTSPRNKTAQDAADAPPMRARITRRPLSPTTYGNATLAYESDTPGVEFRCRVLRSGSTSDSWRRCESRTQGGKSVGSEYFNRLSASRVKYVFTVQPYIRNAGAPATLGEPASVTWRVFNAYAPDRYLPGTGASFNRPLSSVAWKRKNLTKVIRTINSMRGYKQAYPGLCPGDPKLWPGNVRISLYSLTDMRVVNALIAAHKRCVSVQVLMNSHLDRNNNRAWRKLENAFGYKVFENGRGRRSFAHRCVYGCRGSLLHTKMYLFDNTFPESARNTFNNTVMTGSTNMTSNAAKIQYNDLYTVRGRADLFNTWHRMFNLMKIDNGPHRTVVEESDPPYHTVFWPQRRGSADVQLRHLRSIRCTGATGGTGINGRTVVYINMHAWFGTRGLAFADQARRMYNAGCYVRVLYSFMSWGVFKKLRQGTNSRMVVRRTVFSRNGRHAYVYSHMKAVAASGYVGNDRSAKVVWTGSSNWTNHGPNFDEVQLRIPSASAYRAYVGQWNYIRNRLSSTTYANYSEPEGGGRAPRMAAGGDFAMPPPGTPVIEDPAIRIDENGQPYAVD